MRSAMKKTAFILIAVFMLAIFAKLSVADPEGVTPTFVSNTTKNATTPGSRSDPGGYITTINFSVSQQNSRWKAYVGNVTGRFTLDDANGNTIYDWTISNATVTGEVFATRNDSISWSLIGCANSTILTNEDTQIGMSVGQSDSITTTFGSTTHKQFQVAGTTLTNSTCPSTATWVNDTAQVLAEDSLFQEVLLDDNTHMIYAALMEQDEPGFEAGGQINTSYDFQMIVADNETAGVDTTYYFYVELG